MHSWRVYSISSRAHGSFSALDPESATFEVSNSEAAAAGFAYKNKNGGLTVWALRAAFAGTDSSLHLAGSESGIGLAKFAVRQRAAPSRRMHEDGNLERSLTKHPLMRPHCAGTLNMIQAKLIKPSLLLWIVGPSP